MLVADIERGGVIASVAGTVALLTPDERRLFRGFLINKFRGDRTLFDDGRAFLEQHTGAPCLGVFPFAEDVHVDAEDSLAVDRRPRRAAPAGAAIAIVQLPRTSNATDFRLLDWADWLTAPPPDGRRYDFVVLPGTKDTLGDLAWLERQGLAAWVRAQHAAGATIVGVCGGYQMLGETHRRSRRGRIDRRRRRRARPAAGADRARGGEAHPRRAGHDRRRGVMPGLRIHMGVTTVPAAVAPFAVLDDGSRDGARAARAIGTYLHGALEDAAVCAEVFGVAIAPAAAKATEHDALARWFSASVERPEAWLL